MALKISFFEKLGLAIRLIGILPFRIFFSIMRTVLMARNRGLPVKPYIYCAVLGEILKSLPPRQMQFLAPSTRDTYKSWMEKMAAAPRHDIGRYTDRLSCDIEELEDGKPALLWLGDRHKAKKFVFFLHGGGYIAPLTPGHLEWCWRAYVAAGIEAGMETAVAVLEYSLCPGSRHPNQLCQVAAGLEKLISSGIQPSHIVIGGDSAGGNLAAQLLYHLVDPHPEAALIKLSEPIGGFFMVSPWLSTKTTDASFQENHGIDMLTADHIHASTAALIGKATPSQQLLGRQASAFPLDPSQALPQGLSRATKRLYVTVGQHEVLRDQGVAFALGVRERNPDIDVRLEIQPRQAHDFILLEGQERQVGECISSMRTWMTEWLVGSKDHPRN